MTNSVSFEIYYDHKQKKSWGKGYFNGCYTTFSVGNQWYNNTDYIEQLIIHRVKDHERLVNSENDLSTGYVFNSQSHHYILEYLAFRECN